MTNTNTATTIAAFAALPIPTVPTGLCWATGSATMPGGCDCPRCRWEAARAAIHRDPSTAAAADAVAWAATPSRESVAAAILAAVAAAKAAPRYVAPGGRVLPCLPQAPALSRLDEARRIIHCGDWRPAPVEHDGSEECDRAEAILAAAQEWERVAFGGGSHEWEWERVMRMLDPINIADDEVAQ